MKRILVTGTRKALFERDVCRALDAVDAVLTQLGESVTYVHGACPTGVDSYVSGWVAHQYRLGATHEVLREEKHEAQWNAPCDQRCHHSARLTGYCPSAGPRRNARMVALGADLCLAFPDRIGLSRGTKNCMELAERAGIPVIETVDRVDVADLRDVISSVLI